MRFDNERRFLPIMVLACTLLIAVALATLQPAADAQAASPQAGATTPARPLGTIKAISGNTITLTSDAGPVFDVSVADTTRLLRIEPGQKDLKSAMPLQMQDLQVGDRILAVGKVAPDGHSLQASTIIAMKKADVESKQETERQEWQRHGTGGLVKSVDPSAGTITISATSLAGAKTITIHTTKDTILRRYAPDSVNFDDAKPSTLDQIKPGDQVRARGAHNDDGNELTADEIVAGSFRNIAGTISSIDPATNTISVADLISKKPVVVKITSQSQVRKLSPQAAQFMAARLKRAQAGPGGAAESGSAVAAPSSQNAGGAGGASTGAPGEGRRPGGGRGAGGDLQQVLSRMPPASISDLQKGDAVMIVSTEGTGSGAVTAITLVGGVEQILEASPAGSQSMVLPPWTLDAPGGDDAAQ